MTADGRRETGRRGFAPTKTGTWTVPDGAEVKLSGLPDGWASYKNLDAKPGTLSYDIKKGDVTVVTWTFTYDSTTDPDKPATGVDALKGVAATVDGKPLPSFDPTKSGTYRVAKGAEVKISNVPSDWKLDKTASDSKLVFAASKDGTTVTWTFEYQGKDDGGATTNPGDNAGNKSQNNNDGTTSKPPVNGREPARLHAWESAGLAGSSAFSPSSAEHWESRSLSASRRARPRTRPRPRKPMTAKRHPISR